MTTQTLISVPVIVLPEEGSTGSDPVSISGTAVPNATVEVAASGALVLSVSVDPSGRWQGQAKLAKGVHQINARQQFNGSTSVWSPVRTFTVD
ncbi:hypothetical protein AB7M29_005557 [Pseudomonas sp. F-14 TE3623]|uniref:Bacterial Ig-like domain-containing protein n=1 Tax=Pseudomonas farris TaxID=2841207 RepID=A0ABS6PNK1_9PSED|nr:hypothetical protein [Pseudomonas farris]MBV4462046.1 hypothetical protein [Pseudomonas farris]